MELKTEVEKGFKKTLVGLIPEAWEFSKVGNGIDLISGHHVMAKYCNTKGQGTPYITGPADFPNGIIRQNKFTSKPSSLCLAGDILVTVKGSGAGSIVFADDKYCISRQLMAIRVQDWDNQYLYYALYNIKDELINAATGLIPGLSRSDILDRFIPKPTLIEQQAIASALSDVDELIHSLDVLIQKKEAIKKGTMQQLLKGKKHLPGFDGDWEIKELEDVAENISSGKSNTKTKIGKYPVYGSTGIIGWDSTNDYQGDKILVARVGANAGTVNQVRGKYNVSDNTLMITLKSNVNIDFIRYYLIHYDLGTLIFGSGQPLITGGQLKKLDIKLPILDLQNKIVEILSDMDREIQILRLKREKFVQIKQGMMQELLTGRVRFT